MRSVVGESSWQSEGATSGEGDSPYLNDYQNHRGLFFKLYIPRQPLLRGSIRRFWVEAQESVYLSASPCPVIFIIRKDYIRNRRQAPGLRLLPFKVKK